jgi:hypothetical protein
MEQPVRDREAYRKVIDAFRKCRNGATTADIVARTALPFRTVRDLVPLAADEYAARLEVTESGEIRYSFPRGFTSKYHGFRAGLRKVGGILKRGIKTFSAWFFKVWIMVMLLGYFVLFMLIALAALLLSTAAGSSNSDSRSSSRGGGVGGLYLASNIFNMIIRIWFYSELLSPRDNRSGSYRNRREGASRGRPLYKAIFSFVFGDGDPNADWLTREKQGVIAWIRENRGVISLPEFMALTGNTPGEAEERICAYCAEFGGMPEATGDGTVVYRFDELLRRGDPRKGPIFPGLSAPLKRLRSFSANTKKLNGWFSLINGANLGFGAYFLFNALNTGAILSKAAFEASSYLYGVSYLLLSQVIQNPLPFITLGLGIIPLVFSFIFWIIPGIRYLGVKRDNEAIKMENLRKDGYARIWDKPLSVKTGDLNPQTGECRPKNMEAAQDRVVKEIGAYAVPEIQVDDAGAEVYTFAELAREKAALEKYRASIDPGAYSLGNVVFDSHGDLPEGT